jgi:AAA domain
MRIISADERLAERRGAKILLVGPSGAGKTSQLRPRRTLFLDIEAGDYGLHARETIAWLNQLQHARGMNVIFVGILEKIVDDFNVATWQLQMEGAKTSRELPGIIDQIITMQWVDFGDRKPVRAFVCTSPNPWGYPAKDRVGRLEQVEEPHLGKLIVKLVGSGERNPFTSSPGQNAQN